MFVPRLKSHSFVRMESAQGTIWINTDITDLVSWFALCKTHSVTNAKVNGTVDYEPVFAISPVSFPDC